MQEFDIITHNLANVSTVGYKRISNAFSRSLDAQQSELDTETMGSLEIQTALDFSQGAPTQTDRPLDFALHGKGFFVIETPDGPFYTRNGMFNMNPDGQIVDSDGYTVAGQSGPVTIPANVAASQITVTSDGSISANGTIIGKFSIVDFGDDEGKLVPAGGTRFNMPDASVVPTEAANIVVRQGFQESSNVSMVEELVDMIMVTRLYEANMKAITATTEASASLMAVAMG